MLKQVLFRLSNVSMNSNVSGEVRENPYNISSVPNFNSQFWLCHSEHLNLVANERYNNVA